MDVTSANFDEVLPRISSALDTCAFFSVDAEFTGLHLTDSRREDEFDDPEQRYVRVKQSAQSFLIMQLGLSMFDLDEVEGGFTSQTFNLYVFPRKSDLRFTCQASSLEFLKKHGFDFNKFVYSGIPYQTLAQQLLFQKSKQKAEEKKQRPIVLTNEADLTFVRQQIVQARQWLDETEGYLDDSPASPSYHERTGHVVDDPSFLKELVLEPCNSYIRAVLYQELEKQFGNDKFYVDAMQFKTKSRLLSLKLTRGSAEVVSARQAKVAAEKKREVERAVGIGHVVQLLVASKKPMVGHNMLMDICYFYQQFIGPLPPTFEEFRKKMMLRFPGGVYDTKYLAGMFPNVFPPTIGTSLEAVYDVFANLHGPSTAQPDADERITVALNLENAKAYAAGLEAASPTPTTFMKEQGFVGDGAGVLTDVHLPSVRHAKGFCRYQNIDHDNSYSHEAGYDAFMTGAVFVWLVKLFEARSSMSRANFVRGNVLQSFTDPVLRFANRLHVKHSDMAYLPLKGEYVIPDRSRLFYMHATEDFLPPPHELLSRLVDMGFEASRLIWVNPGTCIVDLKARCHVDNFVQAVSDSKWNVKVMPFSMVQELSRSKVLADGSPKRKVSEDSAEALKWPRWESSNTGKPELAVGDSI